MRHRKLAALALATGAGIYVSALMVTAAAVAEPRTIVGSGGTGLPGTLVGDAAVVALAFSLPAILAGVWIAARRIAAAIGLRGALVICCLLIAGAFAHATLEHRPDLLARMMRL